MNSVNNKSILDKFVIDFIKILEKYSEYMIVAGFTAIASGRNRGTEDIDLIVRKISFEKFKDFFKEIYSKGFECVQTDDFKEAYNLYLKENDTIRFVRKGTIAPDIKFKFERNKIDDYLFTKKTKLPLTGLDVYFGSIEATIAFKEYLLASEKDFEDVDYLRKLYKDQINEKEINKIIN
jgi:hypothetical protein